MEKSSKHLKIIFVVTDFRAGSNIVKGVQVSNQIKEQGYDSNVVDTIPADTHDSIIVFIGGMAHGHRLDIKYLEKLKLNNNTLLIDPVDNLCYVHSYINEEMPHLNLMDGIIFTNKFSEEHFMQSFDCKSIVIPHHYDNTLNRIDIPEKDNSFPVCYAGSYYQDIYFEKKPNWLYTNFEGHTPRVLEDLLKAPIHFSHRSSKYVDHYFKPGTKLAVASATNSIFLTSKDKSVVEILGENYPLYVDEDINKTKMLVDHVKENIDQYKGLLTEVKSKLNIENIYLEYLKFFRTFI